MSKCEVAKAHNRGANKKTLHIKALNSSLFSKFGVNFITITNVNFIGNLHNNRIILRPSIAETIPNNHNLILTMVITCMLTV